MKSPHLFHNQILENKFFTILRIDKRMVKGVVSQTVNPPQYLLNSIKIYNDILVGPAILPLGICLIGTSIVMQKCSLLQYF
jgi:hypothetical protein